MKLKLTRTGLKQIFIFIIISITPVNLSALAPSSNKNNKHELNPPVQTDSVTVIQDSSSQSIKTVPNDSDITKKSAPPPKPVRNISLREDSVFAYSPALDLKELKMVIYRHLGDLAKSLPGIELDDQVSTGLPVFIRIHGSTLQQVPVFIDGIPLNSDQFGAFDLSLLPANAFEKIEVLGGNTRHLVNAPIGGINLKTRTYTFSKPYSEILWHKGQHGDSEVDVTFGQKIAVNTDAVAAVCYKSSQGYFTHSEYDAQKIRARLKTLLNPNWTLKYQIFHNRSQTELPQPSSLNPAVSNMAAQQSISLYNHLLQIHGNIFADSLEDISIKIYYNSLFQEFKDKPNNLMINQNNRFLGSQSQIYLPFRGKIISFGLQYEYRWMNLNKANNESFHNVILSNHFEILNNRVQFFSSIEGNSSFGLAFCPVVIFNLLSRDHTKFDVKYHFTRRLPTFCELYWQTPFLQGNPEIKPEQIQNISLNHSFQTPLKIDFLGESFIRFIQDPIEPFGFADSNLISFKNFQRNNVFGHNEELYFKVNENFQTNLVFSILATNNNHHNNLINQPAFSARLHLNYRHNFFKDNLKLRFRTTLIFIGERWSFSSYYYPFPGYQYSDELVKLEYEPIINVKISGNIKDLDFFIGFENLLSQKYEYISGYQMRGFSFVWGLVWRFRD